MSVVFSKFVKITQLCQLNIKGAFKHDWGGDYDQLANGKDFNPADGSGLVVGQPKLNANSDLPIDISKLVDQQHFIYCIISETFPILYVGISTGDLRSGVFGGGRLHHHIRKLLGSIGGGTNHTEGWQHHAVERYEAYKMTLASGQDVTWVDDVYIAIAQVDHPKLIEGTVLDCYVEKFIKKKIEVEVLNTAKVKRQPANIELPKNLNKILIRCRETREGLEPVRAEFNSSARDYAALTNFANDEDGRLFELLLRWARTYSDSEMLEGFVKGYSNQPQGYNSKPVIRFAELGRAGKAMPHSWLCRIPLKTTVTSGMTIILPERLMRASLPQTQYVRGNGTNFRPVDVEDFLSNPDRYLA